MLRQTRRALTGSLLLMCFAALGEAVRAEPPPFHSAAARGDGDTLNRLLQADASLLLAADDDGNTALHHAAWNGQTGIARILLERGCPPDVRQVKAKNPNDGWTPLFQASANGQTEMVKLLLSAGAKPDTRDAKGNTPLHLAAQNGHTDAAKLLLDAGVPADSRRTEQRVTPLEMASYYNHKDIVRLLLGRGADPNGSVYDGNTPLIQAARQGNTDVMLLLVGAKANMGARRDDGQTALHVAAAGGQTRAVELLLGLGTDANATAKNGDTPLGSALRAGQQSTANLLQEHLAAQNENDRQAALLHAMNGGAAPTPGENDTLVYLWDGTKNEPGEAWTTSQLGASFADIAVGAAPTGGTRFLGAFGTQEVRLSLPKLPPHTRVTVSVTLHVLGTWDGNLPSTGPDVWEAGIVNGPTLLRTTFSNTHANEMAAPIQSFPGWFPGEVHPARTGAVANDTLHIAQTPQDFAGARDATYKLVWTFTHRADYLVLRFAARGLESLENESWALGRVAVRVGGANAGLKH